MLYVDHPDAAETVAGPADRQPSWNREAMASFEAGSLQVGQQLAD